MDATMLADQPTGFYAWILEYGQIVAFFAQLIYWLAMIVLLAYAVANYKRWVNYQMGVGKSGKLRKAEEAETGETKEAEGKGVSVEEFVE